MKQGDKRRKIGEREDGRDQISEIMRLYGRFENDETSKVFANADFGYTRVTVEQPRSIRVSSEHQRRCRGDEGRPHV